MRHISCSFPTRCFMVAMTPCSWTLRVLQSVIITTHPSILVKIKGLQFDSLKAYPWIVYLAPMASNTGSAPKPSQLRPSRGLRPRGPTVGPR